MLLNVTIIAKPPCCIPFHKEFLMSLGSSHFHFYVLKFNPMWSHSSYFPVLGANIPFKSTESFKSFFESSVLSSHSSLQLNALLPSFLMNWKIKIYTKLKGLGGSKNWFRPFFDLLERTPTFVFNTSCNSIAENEESYDTCLFIWSSSMLILVVLRSYKWGQFVRMFAFLNDLDRATASVGNQVFALNHQSKFLEPTELLCSEATDT